MDDRRFDALTRLFGKGASRRTLIKGMFGTIGITTAGSLPLDGTEAARRPTPTPKPRGCPGLQTPCGDECCCPPEMSRCGADCCPDDQAQCCGGACCYGTCVGEELCCSYPAQYCSVDGCCHGTCVEDGRYCCSSESVCGDSCCQTSEYCCAADPNTPICRPVGSCCVDTDCVDGMCDAGSCIPNPPLSPSFQITFSKRLGPFCAPIVEMSGFAPGTTYHYQLDVRMVDTGQTDILFKYDKATDGSGNAIATNVADITTDQYEVQAFMDEYASDWVLVSC